MTHTGIRVNSNVAEKVFSVIPACLPAGKQVRNLSEKEGFLMKHNI